MIRKKAQKLFGSLRKGLSQLATPNHIKMEKRHRRSAQHEAADTANGKTGRGVGNEDEEEEEVLEQVEEREPKLGRFYPSLFDGGGEDGGDEAKAGGARVYPTVASGNRSWPPTASVSLMEEQDEEEDDGDGRDGGEESSTDDEQDQQPSLRLRSGKRRARTAAKTNRRSLPAQSRQQQRNEQQSSSRSRSGGQRGQRGQKQQTSGGGAKESATTDWMGTAAGCWQAVKDYWQRQIQPYQLVGIGIIALVLIIFLLFLGPLFIAYKQLTPEQQFENFRADLKQLVLKEVAAKVDKQQKVSRRLEVHQTLAYIADKMLRRNEQMRTMEDGHADGQPLGPMTLLVASGDSKKAERLALEFTKLMERHWPSARLQHSLNPTVSRQDLERQVLKPIVDKSTELEQQLHRNVYHQPMLLLLLEGIDRLKGSSPLFLHSLADAESSPLLYTHSNVLIVGTLELMRKTVDEEEKDGGGALDGEKKPENCSERIESSLLNQWQSASALSDDHIRPILSRISAHAICLD